MSNIPAFYYPDSTQSVSEQLRRRQVEVQTAMQGVMQTAGGQDVNLGAVLSTPFPVEEVASKNCENLLGSVAIPMGVAGPVMVTGSEFSQPEEVVLPLATTEGALVASVNRGAKCLRQAGPTQVRVTKVGITRAPVFGCRDNAQAHAWVEWLQQTQAAWKVWLEEESSHLQFLGLQTWVRGRYAFVRMAFDPDQAMGMNMSTLAIQHWWEQLQRFGQTAKAAAPVNKLAIAKPASARVLWSEVQLHWLQANLPDITLISLSSNVCTDKKESAVNRLLGRGYLVEVEADLPVAVVESVLKTTPATLLNTFLVKNVIGSQLAESHSANMQVGNVVAAMYAATGQDLAHVTDGSQANLWLELGAQTVRAWLTLPSVLVGVVGGGTGLPAQAQARSLIRWGRPVTAAQLAGVVGVAALAAELSGLAALAGGTLAQAHRKLGRGK